MSKPLVSIIVTSYCPESSKYLDLCVRSIRNLSYTNLETIIVGRPDYKPVYNQCKTISPPEQNFWNGRGINYGVEHASGEYLFIINDDVILTRDCVEPLLQPAKFGNVMPMSNDQQGRYQSGELFAMHRGLIDLGVEWARSEEATLNLINYPWPKMSAWFYADTLCLYAHMVHRDVWNKVGPMDDNSGLIDIDWCLRVRQAGFMNAIELSSLVWHFGGSSVEHTLDGPKRLKQREQFKNKWGWVP